MKLASDIINEMHEMLELVGKSDRVPSHWKLAPRHLAMLRATEIFADDPDGALCVFGYPVRATPEEKSSEITLVLVSR